MEKANKLQSRSIFRSRFKVKYAVLRPSVQQVILLSPPFHQINTFLSPSHTILFPSQFDALMCSYTTTSTCLLSFLRIFQFFYSPSTYGVLCPLLLLDVDVTSFLLQHNLTTCFSRTRFSDPSTGMCRACAKCYRAQLVLRVRQKRASFLFLLAPTMFTLLPLPASWLLPYFLSFFHSLRFFYCASFSIVPCAARAARAPPSTYFSPSFFVPLQEFSISLLQLLTTILRRFLSCSLFAILYSYYFFLPNSSFFLCYTMVSSCRAYATIKHSFSIFFPITIHPCCNLSGRSIFLHRFRNTFCLSFFFLFIVLLSFAN